MLTLALALAASPLPPVTIRDLVEVTDLSSLSVSPDGRLLAFRTEQPSIERNRIETRWYVIPAVGGRAATQVADGGEAITGGVGVVQNEPPVWVDDSSAILFRKADGGAVQVWRADVATGRAAPVTDDPGDVRQFQLIAGGSAVSYFAGAPRADIAAEEARLLETGGLVDASVDQTVGLVGGARRFGAPRSVRQASHWFQRKELLDDGSTRQFIQALAGGPRRPSSLPLTSASAGDAKVTRDQFCLKVDCDRQEILFESSTPAPALGGKLVATTGDAQQQSLWLLRPSSARRVVGVAGSLSGSRDTADPCAVRDRAAYCVEAGADLPPRLVRIDLAHGRSRVLFSPNADLAARSARQSQIIRWNDADGDHFAGQLLLPLGPRPATGFPLVISYYLCEGYLRGGTGDELPMRPLLTEGVASLCVNKSAVRRKKQDPLADYHVAQAGLTAIIDRLAAQRLVDRSKVGMQGLSFGSEVTSWMATQSDLLAAAALSSGQLEPAGYWFQIGKGKDYADIVRTIYGLGDPDRTPDDWKRLSAARHAELMKPAMLMQLPESEARWSIELTAKLARSSTPFELFIFPNAPHIKFEPRQKYAAYERNLAWFSYWLAGRTLVDAADPGRSARWRAMANAWRAARLIKPELGIDQHHECSK